jgi:FixJ family two-component response regulator
VRDVNDARSTVIRIVDDDASLRAALTRLLGLAGYDVRGYASAGEFLLDETTRDAPGCMLLDLFMPGPSGLELHEALVRRGDSLPVIYLSGLGDVPSSVRAMKTGAVDFLIKPVTRVVLFAAVRVALAQDERQRLEQTRQRELEARYACLTLRERAVMRNVVAGRLNKQIAADLRVAERTVKWHRAQMMDKMRVASLAELIDVARELRSTTVTS